MTKQILPLIAFATLGLRPCTAPLADSKKKFKELALRHHPDKNRGNEVAARAKFIQIEEAFRALEALYANPASLSALRSRGSTSQQPCTTSKPAKPSKTSPAAQRPSHKPAQKPSQKPSQKEKPQPKPTPKSTPKPKPNAFIDINNTGLPYSLATGSCVCEFCDFQKMNGGAAIHPGKSRHTAKDTQPRSGHQPPISTSFFDQPLGDYTPRTLKQWLLKISSSPSPPPTPWTYSTTTQERDLSPSTATSPPSPLTSS